MPVDFYPGRKLNWDDSSNACIFIDLEDAGAQGIRIQEYVTGQTAPSIEVENNAGTTVFQVLASADTANSWQITAATTTGNSALITANALTTGSGLSVNSSATAITTSGRLFEVFHTGATSTSGVVAEIKTSAADETVLLELDASALTSGTVLDINSALVDAGTVVAIDSLDALTSGMGLNIESAATAMTSAGRLLFVDHSGATSTSGVLSEFASDATDETTVLRATATGVLAAGVVVDISADAMTTGTALDIGTLDALTTGTAIQVESDSADTGTRILVNIVNDNTAATGATCLTVHQDAALGAIAITGATTVGIDTTALGSTDAVIKCTAGTAAITNTDVANADSWLTVNVGGTLMVAGLYNQT